MPVGLAPQEPLPFGNASCPSSSRPSAPLRARRQFASRTAWPSGSRSLAPSARSRAWGPYLNELSGILRPCRTGRWIRPFGDRGAPPPVASSNRVSDFHAPAEVLPLHEDALTCSTIVALNTPFSTWQRMAWPLDIERRTRCLSAHDVLADAVTSRPLGNASREPATLSAWAEHFNPLRGLETYEAVPDEHPLPFRRHLPYSFSLPLP